jgi:hypothetical protein
MFVKHKRILKGMFRAKESNVHPPSSPTKTEEKKSLSIVEFLITLGRMHGMISFIGLNLIAP